MNKSLSDREKELVEKKNALAKEEYELQLAKSSAKKDDDAWKRTDSFMKKVLKVVNVRERDELSDLRGRVFRAFRQEMDVDYTRDEILDIIIEEIQSIQGEIEHKMLIKSDLEEFNQELKDEKVKL